RGRVGTVKQVAFDHRFPVQEERSIVASPKPLMQGYRPVRGRGGGCAVFRSCKTAQFCQKVVGPGEAGGGEIQYVDLAGRDVALEAEQVDLVTRGDPDPASQRELAEFRSRATGHAPGVVVNVPVPG